MRTLIAVVLFAGTVGIAHANPPVKTPTTVPTVEELEKKMEELQLELKDNQVTMSKEGFIAIIQYVKAVHDELERSKKPREVVCYKTSQE